MIHVPTAPAGVDAQAWRIAVNRCLSQLDEGTFRRAARELTPFGLSDIAAEALCVQLQPLAGRNTGVNWGQNARVAPKLPDLPLQFVAKAPESAKMAEMEPTVVPTTVVNAYFDRFDVYIGRKSSYKRVSRHERACTIDPDRTIQALGAAGAFGNPHILDRACPICSGKHHGQVVHQREDGILAFKRDFWARVQADPEFVQALRQLEGKRLGCFCKQSQRAVACHGDVIAAWLNAGCPTVSRET